MRTYDSDTPNIGSRGDLERLLASLNRRVDSMEEDLAKMRKRRQKLESRLQKQEDRYGLLLEDIISLEDSLDEIQAPPADSEPPDDALPIMRLTWSYRASPETLQARERRAAVVWSHFFDVCSRTSTKYVLDSSKVGMILTGDEGSSPHRQTIYRVMEQVATLGEEYVELREVDEKNALVIDRRSFDDYVETLSREVVPA